MVRREKVHALVLSRHNAGEADRSLMLFTRSHGLLRVYAHGVRKIPSRRGGHLEPLTHILAIVTGSQGRWHLVTAEPVELFESLQASAVAQEYALSSAQLITQLFEQEDVQEELFDALQHAWHMFPELSPERQRVLEAALSLFTLRCAGLLPDLSGCGVCRKRVPEEAVILDASLGGWRCLSCHASFAQTETSLPPRLLKALRWLARYPEQALRLTVANDESVQMNRAMRSYLDAVQSTLHPRAYA